MSTMQLVSYQWEKIHSYLCDDDPALGAIIGAQCRAANWRGEVSIDLSKEQQERVDALVAVHVRTETAQHTVGMWSLIQERLPMATPEDQELWKHVSTRTEKYASLARRAVDAGPLWRRRIGMDLTATEAASIKQLAEAIWEEAR